MAGEFQQIIDRINAKSQLILERYAMVNRQRGEAVQRVHELEESLRRMQAENERLAREVEFLRIATTIAPDRKDVADTRAMLSELVREIDRCISDLND
ncbi:MAG: hypothetical protein K2K36_06240 [Muribaculaceae bacterium]|nr:hypothetical protein [Muribaculaceae bacterium]